MANDYAQPTLSGYNASPPSDDGSKVTANQLTWAKHIAKIGDPLKTFMQAVDAAAFAAGAATDAKFGDMFGGAVLEKSTNYTVVATDKGAFLLVTGTSTITLLSAVTAALGFSLLIVNVGSGVVTVDADGTETINGALTKTLGPGSGGVITSDGANWKGYIQPPGVTVVNAADAIKTFALTDANQLHIYDSVTARVWTIPTNAAVSFSKGDVILINCINTGAITLTADTGVVLTSVFNTASTTATSDTVSAGGRAALINIDGADEWTLAGDIID